MVLISQKVSMLCASDVRNQQLSTAPVDLCITAAKNARPWNGPNTVRHAIYRPNVQLWEMRVVKTILQIARIMENQCQPLTWNVLTAARLNCNWNVASVTVYHTAVWNANDCIGLSTNTIAQLSENRGRHTWAKLETYQLCIVYMCVSFLGHMTCIHYVFVFFLRRQ